MDIKVRTNISEEYKELEAEAEKVEAGRTIFDPDAPEFVMPENMPKANIESAIQKASNKAGGENYA